MSGHVCAENVPIFNHLSHENLEKISGIMQHRCYAKGEIIYSPNKSCGLFILAKGRIKVYQLSGFGKGTVASCTGVWKCYRRRHLIWFHQSEQFWGSTDRY